MYLPKNSSLGYHLFSKGSPVLLLLIFGYAEFRPDTEFQNKSMNYQEIWSTLLQNLGTLSSPRATDLNGDDYSFINYVGHIQLGIKAINSTIDFMEDGLVFEIPIFLVQGEKDILTPAEIPKAYFDKIKAPKNFSLSSEPPMILIKQLWICIIPFCKFIFYLKPSDSSAAS